jgi:hypothetical protein
MTQGVADKAAMRERPPGRGFSLAFGEVGLAQILCLAIALRLVVLPFATPTHPDEIFQYLEPAHRLVFGRGVITWEWRDGIRSWLIPVLVSLPMRLGAWVEPRGALYLVLPNLTMAMASLSTVWAAWSLGARVSPLHARVAALVAAIWYEFIYFAPHVTSEGLAIICILPAAAILLDHDRWSSRRLMLAAALLAAAAGFRFQYLPAVATLVLIACWGRFGRAWPALLLGVCIGLAPCALVDWAMGQVPFAWIAENIRLNVVESRAAAFGASGPLGYLADIWPRTALWTIPLLLFSAVGAKRYPALAWAAVVNFVFHSAIGHKEYRFILLSTAIVVILAAIGTVDGLRALERKDGSAAGRLGPRLLIFVWLAASVSCGLGGFRSEWMKFHPAMAAYARLRDDPSACGLAIDHYRWTITGGYSYLHRPIPIYYFADEDPANSKMALAANANAFNTVMIPAPLAGQLPSRFQPLDCWGDGATSGNDARLCLYRRPGSCTDGDGRFQLNKALVRLDQ